MNRISQHIRALAALLVLIFALAISVEPLHHVFGDCQHHLELFQVQDLDADWDSNYQKLSNGYPSVAEKCALHDFTFSKSYVLPSNVLILNFTEFQGSFISSYQHIRTQSEVANQSLRGPPVC